MSISPKQAEEAAHTPKEKKTIKQQKKHASDTAVLKPGSK